MKDEPVLLVVDDQIANIELLEVYLSPQGYHIIKAHNGAEALAKLASHSIDLILSDVMMPGMDGFEFTHKVKTDERFKLIPVVLITALQEKEDRVRGIEAGCDDFISKPVDRLELLARVKSLLKVKAYNDLRSHYQNELIAEVALRTAELKASFVENAKLEQQLFQSKKMEAIGRLASGVAHDFNNILQVIQGFTDHLIQKTPPDDSRQMWLKQIRIASDKATLLVQSLLTFSRKQTRNPVLLNLNAVIEEITPMLRQFIGVWVELELSLCLESPSIMADRSQLDQILMNLAANARDAMTGGGTLFISTGFGADTESGRLVRLSVRDTGTGMDEATIEHIFEPFFTTKAIGKGTGLGLATVYGAVKMANAQIACRSKAGEGTEFEILFPGVPQ